MSEQEMKQELTSDTSKETIEKASKIDTQKLKQIVKNAVLISAKQASVAAKSAGMALVKANSIFCSIGRNLAKNNEKAFGVGDVFATYGVYALAMELYYYLFEFEGYASTFLVKVAPLGLFVAATALAILKQKRPSENAQQPEEVADEKTN